MTTDIALSALGAFGASLFIGSYALLQFGRIGGNSVAYVTMNLIAAICVLLTLLRAFDTVAAAMFVAAWATLSLYGLARMSLVSRAGSPSEEDGAFAAAKLPLLSPRLARSVLEAGCWRDGATGDVLIREGEPNDRAIHLASGSIELRVGGVVIGRRWPGDLIGATALVEGGTSQVTARLLGRSRYLSLDARALRALAAGEAEIARSLQALAAAEFDRSHASAGARARRGSCVEMAPATFGGSLSSLDDPRPEDDPDGDPRAGDTGATDPRPQEARSEPFSFLVTTAHSEQPAT